MPILRCRISRPTTRPDEVSMSLVIYFFGSGFAFFGGVALVLFGIAASWWRPRLTVLPALIGLILIALSAAPLPYWFYAIAGAATFLWLLAEALHRKVSGASLKIARAVVAGWWLAGVAAELPYQIAPDFDASGQPALWIIGDSVTAGVGDQRTKTWPGILARAHGI